MQEFAPDTPIIYADRQKLRQVFLNLLTNANDAMPQGGTLTLRTAPATLADGKPAVLIEFADTGVGIPAENLERIMEPFFTTKEEGKGTGLGLAICRRSRSRSTTAPSRSPARWAREPPCASCCPSATAPTWIASATADRPMK